MTQLTDDLITFEVPEGATNFRIMKFSQPETFSYDYSIQKGDRCTTGLIAMIDLPPGTWQILCTTKEATNGQIQDIIDWQFESAVRIGFRNYLGGESDYSCRYSSESLNSLLTSKGLDVNKNYVLLEKRIDMT